MSWSVAKLKASRAYHRRRYAVERGWLEKWRERESRFYWNWQAYKRVDPHSAMSKQQREMHAEGRRDPKLREERRGYWYEQYEAARAKVNEWEQKVSDRRALIERRNGQIAESKPKGSARAEAVRWALSHAGITESPAGSNQGGKITQWQQALGNWLVGQAWCGVFCAAALKHAGVEGVTWRLASVAMIEDDARTGRDPFRGWTKSTHGVRRGDLVVLFGRGVHVELVERIEGSVVHTIGGNTSPGNSGSQANGGGVFRRQRPLSSVHGFALVDYPG